MASFKIVLDTSDMDKKLERLKSDLNAMERRALQEMADTILTLARAEVPHDEGTLANSGDAYVEGDFGIVAFNTKYAAYQHEGMRKDGTHVVRRYKSGRKKKYLEDPLKKNLTKLNEVARDQLASILR